MNDAAKALARLVNDEAGAVFDMLSRGGTASRNLGLAIRALVDRATFDDDDTDGLYLARWGVESSTRPRLWQVWESSAQAWRWLLSEVEEAGLGWQPAMPEDPNGPQDRSTLALALERRMETVGLNPLGGTVRADGIVCEVTTYADMYGD